MKTITIQIGNSDDKLTQKEWARFWADINHEIVLCAGGKIHFCGLSPSQQPWQNGCWVVEIDGSQALALRDSLKRVREEHKQDSIAWTEGDTAFV